MNILDIMILFIGFSLADYSVCIPLICLHFMKKQENSTYLLYNYKKGVSS